MTSSRRMLTFPCHYNIPVYLHPCCSITLPRSNKTSYETATIFEFWCGCVREKVNLLYAMLRKMRVEVSDKHKSWYDESVVLAEKVGTVPSRPRIVGRQKHHTNQPSDSPSDYFWRIVSIPFLDHLISQIELRFSERNTTILNAFYVLPTNVVSNRDWRQMLARFLELYEDYLPEPRYISTELAMWEEYWYVLMFRHSTLIYRRATSTSRSSFFSKYLCGTSNHGNRTGYYMHLWTINFCTTSFQKLSQKHNGRK